jgi:hypothetical protein
MCQMRLDAHIKARDNVLNQIDFHCRRSRAKGVLFAAGLAMAASLSGCATPPPSPPSGPVATRITVAVADTGWHTDVCIRREDAGAWLLTLPQQPAAARFLCFGFGDKKYMVDHDHSLFATLLSGLPSDAAIVMTPLPDAPATFFGAENVIDVGISRAGAAGLADYVRASIRADAAGKAERLGDGPVPGRLFFAATDLYGGLNTCNTWTGTALQAAGLKIRDGALFASDVTDQVKAIAAAQAEAAAKQASAAPATPAATAPASAGTP